MSIEKIIIKLEQCCDVLGLYTDANEVPALDMVQESMFDVVQNLQPYVKVVDFA